jgi:hypothetical protein
MRKARVSVYTLPPSRHDACGKGVLGIAHHVQTAADQAALAYWNLARGSGASRRR